MVIRFTGFVRQRENRYMLELRLLAVALENRQFKMKLVIFERKSCLGESWTPDEGDL